MGVVHRLATFALDCVEYCRECQRKISINAPSTLRQASSEPDLELVNNEERSEQGDGDREIRPRGQTMPRSRVPEQAAHLINKIQLSYVRKIQYYSEQALINFYEAVNLSQKSVLQDMLRILKIMEDFNTDIENHNSSSPNDNEFQIYRRKMDQVIKDGFLKCDSERWLKVVPQMIAIMDVRYLDLQPLFCSIGERHAQAILFPLIFAA